MIRLTVIGWITDVAMYSKNTPKHEKKDTLTPNVRWHKNSPLTYILLSHAIIIFDDEM